MPALRRAAAAARIVRSARALAAALLLAGGALVAAGCQGRERAAPPPAALPLGPVALASATYVLGVSRLDTVPLAEGRYRAADGREVLLLPVMTWGDLVGDDRREAAAIVVTRIGGVSYYELVVLEERGGRPVQIAHQYLGDDVAVEGLAIADRAVAVQLRVRGPGDPPCCPSQRVTRRLKIEGGQGR
ncbi:MAG TPA: hypothetical protein VFS40_07060 [Gemmatimonadales bacterium]|nr:hypothetical protein [Gemmatimonadales bacterium]